MVLKARVKPLRPGRHSVNVKLYHTGSLATSEEITEQTVEFENLEEKEVSFVGYGQEFANFQHGDCRYDIVYDNKCISTTPFKIACTGGKSGYYCSSYDFVDKGKKQRDHIVK